VGDYLIWAYKSLDGACVLKDMRGLDKAFRLNNGTPLAGAWPDTVSLHMHPDFPTDILLPDNVLNADMLVVASLRLQECVRSLAPVEVEYLPVKIIDHKRRIANAAYSIIHPTNPVDCIDKEQSIFEPDFIDPNDIDTIDKLVLDDSKIPEDRLFFRLKGFWGITLVRRDVASAITAAGCSGIEWLELDAYPPD
jgi:hypothetical protein